MKNLELIKKVKLHNSNLPYRLWDKGGGSKNRLAMSQNMVPEGLEPSNFPI